MQAARSSWQTCEILTERLDSNEFNARDRHAGLSGADEELSLVPDLNHLQMHLPQLNLVVQCAIELAPGLARSYLGRGFAYRMTGQRSQAVADFRKVISLSNEPDLVKMAGEQLEELGAGQ
jgi:hypothetical protein